MPPKCGYRASLINAYHGCIFAAPDLHSMVTVAITYSRTTVDMATVRSPTPMLTSFLFGFLLFSIATRATESDTLHITAIVGKDGVSQVECWSLLPGYAVSSQVPSFNLIFLDMQFTISSPERWEANNFN